LRRLWVLIVSEGRTLKAAPEVYRSRLVCVDEVERLLRLLKQPLGKSDDLAAGILVRQQRISVRSAPVETIEQGDGLFVGLVLGSDGSVLEGPMISLDKGSSRAWVHEIASGDLKARGKEPPGADTVCSFRRGRRQFVAISSRAKVIAPFPALLETDAPECAKRTEYEVELTIHYTHAVFASVSGPPGLAREQIEARIDEEFPHITAYQGIPVDVDWTLESHRERGAYAVKVRDPDE
jgi:hypothetical protein